jgi:asparaginyl-tRNA synthetase
MTALPTLYIDEKAGSDTEGNGSSLSPFASPLAAYQSLSPKQESDASPASIANFMVRKADSVERNEWVELSASAKKKLIKTVDLWRKKEAKMAKEGERLEKERKEAEERDRQRREEAKSIVLVDDASRGEAKKVRYKL